MKQKAFLITVLLGIVLTTIANEYSTNKEGVVIEDITKRDRIDADLQEMINACPRGLPTNGVFCLLRYFRDGGKELQPECEVGIVNTTSNYYRTVLHLPREVLFEIELFDSDGKQVEKTVVGKSFVTWTQKQMDEWLQEQLRARWHGTFVPLLPFDYAHFGRFGLCEVFQLKQPGEYMLHVRMQLVRGIWDAPANTYQGLQITWLPEVVAKVQIRSEDIPAPNKSLSRKGVGSHL